MWQIKELEREKAKVDELVCKMLPKKIVEDLKAGSSVKAEAFDNVSIYFSDIVGKLHLCSWELFLVVPAEFVPVFLSIWRRAGRERLYIRLDELDCVHTTFCTHIPGPGEA